MNLNKYRCPNCRQSKWQTSSAIWKCENCGHQYDCVRGIPKLYLETRLGEKDRALRDIFYNSLLGTYYQYLMPFLSLPVRPARAYWKGWLIYAVIVLSLLAGIGYPVSLLVFPSLRGFRLLDLADAIFLISAIYFFFRHPYIFYLIVLAIPVRISTLLKKFQPVESFSGIHARLIQEFKSRPEKLQVLDISTGSCNSLYRHGWMKLNADYTGLDLSETMILQGQEFMTKEQIPIEFVMADAMQLPLSDETFDIVLNYGALNGFSDPKLALEEMARVTKKGGLVLFLDEQLYDSASLVERFYFKTVLSSHNVIHSCPVNLMPATLENVKVYQVYQYYYLCTGYKK